MAQYDPTPDQIDEELENLMATPECLAAWLMQECTGDDQPMNVYRLSSCIGLNVPQLLAVAFGSYDRAATAALYELREKFRKDNREDARINAAEALRLADESATRDKEEAQMARVA